MNGRYRVECLNPACRWIGYRRPHPLNECACYDEFAWYCKPVSPGPGCPNGSNLRARCPRCGSDWEPDRTNIFTGGQYLYVRAVRNRAFIAQILSGRAKRRETVIDQQ